MRQSLSTTSLLLHSFLAHPFTLTFCLSAGPLPSTISGLDAFNATGRLLGGASDKGVYTVKVITMG